MDRTAGITVDDIDRRVVDLRSELDKVEPQHRAARGVDTFSGRRGLRQVLGGVALARWAIAGAAVVIGRQTIHGSLAAGIGIAALAILVQRRVRVREPALAIVGAAAGLALHH